MNIKSFITQSNTIYSGSEINTALNPVVDLFYGDGFSRYIFKVDISKIKEKYTNGEFPITSGLTHNIKFFNAGRFDKTDGTDDSTFGLTEDKKRTSSFKLVVSEIDMFDEGNGYSDYISVSKTPSNWYKPTNTSTGWTAPTIIGYTNNFSNGYEDLTFDMTSFINNKLESSFTGDTLYLSLSFESELENTITPVKQYVGFFSPHAHSIYRPHLESIYNVNVNDDRNDFYLDKANKVYLYFNTNGRFKNLDSLPTCTINGTGYTVTHESLGCYSVLVDLSSSDVEPDTMMFDTWSNLYYNSRHLKDQEKDFVVKDSSEYYMTDRLTEYKPVPSLYGIRINEEIRRGDVTKINLISKIPYTTYQTIPSDLVEYRVYFKDYNIEQTVIDWLPINKSNNEMFFIIDTLSLLPSKYYIDIRYNLNDEIKYYYEVLTFKVY